MDQPPGTERVRRWPQWSVLTPLFALLIALAGFVAFSIG